MPPPGAGEREPDAAPAPGRAADGCALLEVRAVESEGRHGLPLVEFVLADASAAVDPASVPVERAIRETRPDVTYAVSDSAGRVALRVGAAAAPLLDADRLAYHARSHGYESTAGVLSVGPGGGAVVELDPTNVARRLYRKTGQGIYRDSVQLGYEAPIRDPLLDSEVVGLDSVRAVPYGGAIYWFYGDTERLSYPLGNFQSTGATSRPPPAGGLDPAAGIEQTYIGDGDGFVKPMVPRPPGASDSDLMWLSRVMTVPDDRGTERLVARYRRTAGVGETLGSGLVVFDDDASQFSLLAVDWAIAYPRDGYGTRYEDPDTGAPHWFFTDPWAFARVPADFAAVQRPGAYEYFTPLEPGAAVADGAGESVRDTPIERDADGRAVWDWKADTEPLTQARERALVDAGVLDPDDARLQVVDVDTGEVVAMHTGTVNYNDHRERWVMIFQAAVGTETLGGEIWYAEADAPTGPWRRARKVVTHDDYTFYNPNHHAFLDQAGGRYVYVEGTYTAAFSDAGAATPLYDYNQVVYRLDLDHPRLGLLLDG
ncbi:MAG: hypothetical protein ABEJ08_03655 [Halobacteriaceae archaeon]